MRIYHVFLGLLLSATWAWAEPTLSPPSSASEKVDLVADKLFFDEASRHMVATGNVHLRYKDIEILTDELKLDVDNNVAWGKGHVVFRRGEQEFGTESFILDLDKESVSLQDLRVKVLPPEEKGYLFLHAKMVTDTQEIKTGSSGYATTCDDPRHHHFVWAQKFSYKPEKRILLYNVVFYNEIFRIPIVLWTPFYYYALGERKVVWNFPTIGKKEKDGWGFFVQNTFDYAHHDKNKDSSIYVDWFETKQVGTLTREGNWGYGIKHYYDWGKLSGNVYAYNYDFKEIRRVGGQNRITQLDNTKYELNNTLILNDRVKTSYDFSVTDLDERINSSGQSKTDNKTFKLNYDDLGNKYDFSLKEDQNLVTDRKKLQIDFDRQFNNEHRYDISFKKDSLIAIRKEILDTDAKLDYKLPGKMRLKTNIRYRNENFDNDAFVADEQLTTEASLSKVFTDRLSMNVFYNQLYDLDRDELDSDIRNNNYLYKVPEITLDYANTNAFDKKLVLKQKTTIARYQEKQFDSTTGKIRTFPETTQFNVAPNVLKFEQSVSKTFSFTNQSISLQSTYDQTLFQVPEHSFFDSDAMYVFNYSASYDTDHFSHLRTQTKYSNRSAGSHNNSPFILLQQNNSPRNEVEETFSFYHENVRKQSLYEWKNTTGFNWTTGRWRKYRTVLHVQPNGAFSMQLSGGKLLSPTTQEKPRRFDDTVLTMDITPTKEMRFDYTLAIDTNTLRDDHYTEVSESNFKFSFYLGKLKLYRWHFEGNFVYNTRHPEDREFIANRYELQTYAIVKKEHRRTLEIRYNKSSNETTIRYSLDAFPDDPFELKKTKTAWEVGGKFNQKSEERL